MYSMVTHIKNIAYCSTPIGPLALVESSDAIVRVDWEKPGAPETARSELLTEACRQLREYFSGTRKNFDLPLAPKGTAFQMDVWQALLRIPFGETRSYGEMAQLIGAPKASRAVGMANHRNPISIIIPCHRVIGSNGKLVGYASGLNNKRFLLNHEATTLPLLLK
jgi:methylated-DNA-[protein]-cysteine S-methyltransferase